MIMIALYSLHNITNFVHVEEMHEALRSLLQYHGWRGLWKGLGPTLLRDVPFSGIFFFIYMYVYKLIYLLLYFFFYFIYSFSGIYWVSYEKIKMMNSNKTTFGYSFLGGSIAGGVS